MEQVNAEENWHWSTGITRFRNNAGVYKQQSGIRRSRPLLFDGPAYGWRQLALADNAEEIRRLAEDLYGRLGTFVGHLNKVGKQLSSSVDNYNRAVGSLERKVLPGARKFVELGIHPKKEIERIEAIEALPRTIVEPSNDNDDESGDKTLQ